MVFVSDPHVLLLSWVQKISVLLEAMCTPTGPPPGANMGMGMMNPDMMGMMQQHDLGMGFDLSQGGP